MQIKMMQEKIKRMNATDRELFPQITLLFRRITKKLNIIYSNIHTNHKNWTLLKNLSCESFFNVVSSHLQNEGKSQEILPEIKKTQQNLNFLSSYESDLKFFISQGEKLSLQTFEREEFQEIYVSSSTVKNMQELNFLKNFIYVRYSPLIDFNYKDYTVYIHCSMKRHSLDGRFQLIILHNHSKYSFNHLYVEGVLENGITKGLLRTLSGDTNTMRWFITTNQGQRIREVIEYDRERPNLY